MLSGLPCSGKSTWVENNRDEDDVVISTDAILEDWARKQGITYSEIFEKEIRHATAVSETNLRFAVKMKQNIIWDQTNLTVNSRTKKLKKIDPSYTRKLVFFNVPFEVILRRLPLRPGKVIPINVINQMRESMQFPTYDEGWDIIEFIEYKEKG